MPQGVRVRVSLSAPHTGSLRTTKDPKGQSNKASRVFLCLLLFHSVLCNSRFLVVPAKYKPSGTTKNG